MAKAPTTKKVKLSKSISGLEFSYAFGQIVEVDSKLADAWIKSGTATEVV